MDKVIKIFSYGAGISAIATVIGYSILVSYPQFWGLKLAVGLGIGMMLAHTLMHLFGKNYDDGWKDGATHMAGHFEEELDKYMETASEAVAKGIESRYPNVKVTVTNETKKKGKVHES